MKKDEFGSILKKDFPDAETDIKKTAQLCKSSNRRYGKNRIGLIYVSSSLIVLILFFALSLTLINNKIYD